MAEAWIEYESEERCVEIWNQTFGGPRNSGQVESRWDYPWEWPGMFEQVQQIGDQDA